MWLRLTWMAVAAVVVWLAGPAVRGDDWPQWLGPGRDSVWRESGVVGQLPGAELQPVWRRPIAGGYSGPAVAAGRVYVTDYLVSAGDVVNNPNGRTRLEGQERIHCLDAATGEELWRYAYDCPYEISYPAGPRATPTVDGDRVYMLGAQGHLSCLRAADGGLLWQVHFPTAFAAPTPIWGFCSHPLVVDDTLYCLAGGEHSVVVALDKHTGRTRWTALSAPDAGYSPPTMIDAGGRRQLVVWHPQSVNALDPQSGELFWSVPLEPDFGMSINPVLQSGAYLFAGGVRHKAVMLRLAADRPAAEVLWRANTERGIGPVHTPPVVVDDILYGVDGQGELRAVELATGQRLWSTLAPTTGARPVNSGTGFLVRQGDRFFITSETGDLIIARLTPAGYEEISRARLLEPTHEAFGRSVLWSHPAFANRSVYARNDREIVCVSLAE